MLVLALFLIAAGFIGVRYFGLQADTPLAGPFVILFGIILLWWNAEALSAGKIPLRWKSVSRKDNPVVFWSVFAIKSLIGGALLIGGLYTSAVNLNWL